MGQFLCITLLASSMMFFVASVQAQDAPPPPPPPPPRIPISEWKTFKSEDGNFSVLLPTSPKEDRRTNGQVKIHVFSSSMGMGLVDFKLNYVELPNAVPDVKALWDKTRAGAMADKKMELVSEKVLEVDGHTVLELAAKNNLGFLQIRFFTVGNCIYQLTAFSKYKQAETPEARAFLDSFRILRKPEATKPKQNN